MEIRCRVLEKKNSYRARAVMFLGANLGAKSVLGAGLGALNCPHMARYVHSMKSLHP